MIKICLNLCLLFSFAITSSLFAADANIEKLSDDDWLLIKSKNFEIVTDLNADKGRRLMEDLEAYRYFSIDMMGLKMLPDIKPLRILAIGSASNFRKLGFPDMWAGLFSLDALGYSAIANVSEYSVNANRASFGRQVLFHEYNHFLIRLTENATSLPMWYDEGTAEYWGTFKFDGTKVSIGDSESIAFRAGDMFNDVGNFSIDTQKIMNTRSLPYNSKKDSDKTLISRFYAQSFFLLHYFHSTEALQKSLDDYIKYLGYGYKQDDAFQKAFNTTHEELDKNLKKYLKNRMVKMVYTIKEGKNKVPDTGITITPLTQASFYANVIDILLNCGSMDKDVRKQAVEKNLALNPTDINAKTSALIYGFATDPQQLAKEIEQVAPQNPILLSYKADVLRNGANILRMGGIPNWIDTMKQARSLYRRAIKTDRSLGIAYVGLGDVYNFMPPTEPLQEGAVGFDVATLFNRSASTFSDLADIQIRMDKGLDALPAVRNAVAFGSQKEKSGYSLILDNLELLNDAQVNTGEATATGLQFKSGAIYTGSVVNGKPQGAGKITRANGSYLEANFVNGTPQGQGKLVTYGGFIYEGEFQNGIARGKGKITYPEAMQSVYVGDVFYTAPFGKGVEINKSGKYEGDYWYTWRQGNGTFTSADGKTILKGNWFQSRYEWPEENGITFVGYVGETGKRNGVGICRTPASGKIDWCRYKDGTLQEKLKDDSQEKDKDE